MLSPNQTFGKPQLTQEQYPLRLEIPLLEHDYHCDLLKSLNNQHNSFMNIGALSVQHLI